MGVNHSNLAGEFAPHHDISSVDIIHYIELFFSSSNTETKRLDLQYVIVIRLTIGQCLSCYRYRTVCI